MSAAGDLSAEAQHRTTTMLTSLGSRVPFTDSFPVCQATRKRWLCTRRSSFCWEKEWPLKLFSSSWRLFEQKLCSPFCTEMIRPERMARQTSQNYSFPIPGSRYQVPVSQGQVPVSQGQVPRSFTLVTTLASNPGSQHRRSQVDFVEASTWGSKKKKMDEDVLVQKSSTLWPEIYSPLWTKCFSFLFLLFPFFVACFPLFVWSWRAAPRMHVLLDCQPCTAWTPPWSPTLNRSRTPVTQLFVVRKSHDTLLVQKRFYLKVRRWKKDHIISNRST